MVRARGDGEGHLNTDSAAPERRVEETARSSQGRGSRGPRIVVTEDGNHRR